MIEEAKNAGADCIKFQTHIAEKEMINTKLKPGNLSKKSLWEIIKSCELTEREENKIKLTFRSNGYFIVNTIAKYFGGGGHKFASGALTDFGSMNLIMEKIIIRIKEQIKK